MITVHGIRDDIMTAWIKTSDDSPHAMNWVESELFLTKDIRHLSFAYDNDESARIYHADGIEWKPEICWTLSHENEPDSTEY